MRFRLSILTLFRSPMKTLVTFLLLLATSFAFVSRGAEYATTVAEIDKAETQYSAVGTLQRSTEGYYEYMENLLGQEVYGYENGAYIDRLSNATAPIDAEVVDLVLGSEHIAQDEFFMVAGGLTSAELTNVTEQPLYDIPNYSEWDWYSNEGTFEMDTALVEAYAFRASDYTLDGVYVTDVLIGDESEWYKEGQETLIYEDIYSRSFDKGINTELFEREYDHKYVFVITTRGGTDAWKQYPAVVDYPIVDITRLEEEHGIADYMEALSNPKKYGLLEYINLSGLETTSALEYIKTLYRNFHTQELVHVPEMNKLNKYHSGKLYIVDGRGIEKSDTGFICVISAEYADKNGLAVGDNIEFEISADTMMHSGKVFAREPVYPATDYARNEQGRVPKTEYRVDRREIVQLASEQSLTERGLDTVTRTYEIVGIWSDSNYDVADPFSYSPNTVFVPASTYPWQGEVEPTMLPSTFSFTLNHPGDMAKIEAELGDRLAALGYELSINDMGYAEAKPSFEFIKLSALIGFVAMSAALLLSLILTVYLYIIRKKHDYAIMRALGTTRSRSNRSLLVGLFALAIPAVFLGSLLALALTQGFAADLSAQISEITGNATASSMPAWLVGAFGVGVLALLYVFARIGLVKISRTPPLVLLQGGK